MHYWHDLRKRKFGISRRAFSGGSLMRWGAIFAKGESQLAILDGNQIVESYIMTFNDFFLPLIPEGQRSTITYQQDNATIRRADVT